MGHIELIKSLGGINAVAAATGTDYDRVYQWARAGVAWKFRPVVADLAKAKGVDVPVGFLDPGGKPHPRNGKLRSNGAVLRKGRRKTRKGRQ